MKKATLLFMILWTSTFVFSQVSGNYQYSNQQYSNKTPDRNAANTANIENDNEIVVNILGIKNIVADCFVAMFSISQVGETAEQTNQLMNARIDNLITELTNIGISKSNIKTDLISFVPKYDLVAENKIFSKSYNEVPVGFVLQKNITIQYEKSSDLDKIITAAAKFEIYDIIKVDYFLTNINKQIDSLRNICLIALKNKAKSYEIIGFKLDTMQKVFNDNVVTIYPETRYFTYSAFSRPSLNAANKKNSKIDINEADKYKTSYYSQIKYDNYDIVINPIINEPVVQISYSASIKYFLTRKPNSNKYYIMTSDGSVKQFNP